MQRYWSSLLRYCPRDSVFVGCRSSSTSDFCILGIPLPALLSNICIRLFSFAAQVELIIAGCEAADSPYEFLIYVYR